MDIKSLVRTIPDFPKKGIMFRDITTLLRHGKGFNYVISEFAKRYKKKKIDVVAGIESRGFIIGGAVANQLKVGFVPIRKPGKLPHKTIREDYELEYGNGSLEIHLDAINKGDRVLLIDDLLATGGTAKAAINLIEKKMGKVVEAAFIIELPDLKGREKLKGYPVFSMIEFEGD